MEPSYGTAPYSQVYKTSASLLMLARRISSDFTQSSMSIEERIKSETTTLKVNLYKDYNRLATCFPLLST